LFLLVLDARFGWISPLVNFEFLILLSNKKLLNPQKKSILGQFTFEEAETEQVLLVVTQLKYCNPLRHECKPFASDRRLFNLFTGGGNKHCKPL
jgi:hypothetical protein